MLQGDNLVDQRRKMTQIKGEGLLVGENGLQLICKNPAGNDRYWCIFTQLYALLFGLR